MKRHISCLPMIKLFKHHLQKGFTLLEMLVVLLIISVLFLLIVPNVKNTLDIVNDRGCKALEKVADAAIIEYKMQNGEFPASVDALVAAGLLKEDQTTCDKNNKQLVIIDGTAHIE